MLFDDAAIAQALRTSSSISSISTHQQPLLLPRSPWLISMLVLFGSRIFCFQSYIQPREKGVHLKEYTEDGTKDEIRAECRRAGH
jgi:hypothetical protein